MKKSIIFLSAFAVLTIANIPYYNKIEGLNSQIVSEKFSYANSGSVIGCCNETYANNNYWLNDCEKFIDYSSNCADGTERLSCVTRLAYDIYDFCEHCYSSSGEEEFGSIICIPF